MAGPTPCHRAAPEANESRMRPLSNRLPQLPWRAAACAIGLAGLAGCDPRPTVEPDAGSARTTAATAPGAISSTRLELLEIAFAAASAIPVEPHAKDRARNQELVANAALTLERPELAERYAEQIGSWRKGTALGAIALRYAERGEQADARRVLAAATAVAAVTEEWPKDRVQAAIDRAEAALEGGPRPSTDDRTVEARLTEVTDVASRGNFDEVKGALESCVELYGRHYQEPERRTLIENTLTSSWTRLPIAVRIDLLAALARKAVERGDHPRAITLLERADAMVAGASWLPEEEVPTRARLAALRGTAGDAAGAAAQAEAAWTVYQTRIESMVDIDRADALRPLAATFASIGAADRSRACFRTAIDAGAMNPNARPRAEDLAATCAAMAVAGVEPDAELMARIHSIAGGLSAPW